MKVEEAYEIKKYVKKLSNQRVALIMITAILVAITAGITSASYYQPKYINISENRINTLISAQMVAGAATATAPSKGTNIGGWISGRWQTTVPSSTNQATP